MEKEKSCVDIGGGARGHRYFYLPNLPPRRYYSRKAVSIIGRKYHKRTVRRALFNLTRQTFIVDLAILLLLYSVAVFIEIYPFLFESFLFAKYPHRYADSSLRIRSIIFVENQRFIRITTLHFAAETKQREKRIENSPEFNRNITIFEFYESLKIDFNHNFENMSVSYSDLR